MSRLRRSLEKLRAWQRRSKPLERGTSELKRTEIKPVNRQRAKKRRERDFGEKGEWMKTLPCLVCGAIPSDPHHYPSRGAGGTLKDMTPLCRKHHNEFHMVGPETFKVYHRVDLIEEAESYHRAWLLRGAA